ncbi:MAG: M48 family metallopeptidase [Bacteroidales bacterium]|nr:M48 family metallopeptidase [Bacteroidales bacterium]
MASMLYWLVIAIVLAEFVWSTVLTLLNIKASHGPVPDVLQGLYDEARYRKQQDYAMTNRKFSLISDLVSTLVTLAIFAFGGFGLFDAAARTVSGHPVVQALVFWGIFYLLSWVISIPFDLYRTFVIEQRFGFNRTTPGLFAADAVKSLLMNMIIMGAVLALCAWIYTLAPRWFWLIAWGAVTLFSLFMQYFYSQLIVPLFNKQTPLPEGELRDAIEAFAARVDFRLDNIYVIDSSKRSSKSNAYFTGFGRKKRVVLYDTLMEQLSTEEIVGVLAHEIGHYKHRHVILSSLEGFATNLLMFWLFSLFIGSEELAAAAGCQAASFHVNLAVFSLIYTPLSLLLDIATNVISRRHERQADAFAAAHGLGHAEASALKKMSAKSLANLTPHPLVVFTEYSHPTLAERVRALTQTAQP